MPSEPNRDLLAIALQYAGRGWPVFPLSRSKVPLKGSHGFKDASCDPAEVTRLFEAAGDRAGHVGLATGAIVVADGDGEGVAELRDLARAAGGIADLLNTLSARSPRGWHFFFACPPGMTIPTRNAPRTVKGGPGIDIKGAGGYVVLPPGRGRQWARERPLRTFPQWLLAWLEKQRRPRAAGTPLEPTKPTMELAALGAVPAWLTAAGNRLAEAADAEMADYERPRLLEALKKLDSGMGYEEWFAVGAAIHSYDPGPKGLLIFKHWSWWRSAAHRTEADQIQCEKKWVEYGKPKEGKRLKTIAHIYDLANKIDEENTTKGQEKKEYMNGHSHDLPPEFLAKSIIFPETDAKGKPKPTCINTRHAIEGLGIVCRKDVFHGRFMVGGHVVEAYAGDLTDEAVQMLRVAVWEQYKFDPGERNARDAAVQLCLQNQFDPVCDYLAGLRWDGRRRLERWVVDYLGAPDTELHREFGKLMLVAAVRRARAPGTKFDQIIVLEGPQNQGKSTAIKILAGADNFSDQNIFNASDREQQEASCGVWIHEIAELEGLARAAVQKIKQFARRTEDRARPAYGRFRIDAKRRGIFTATTNETAYLKEYDRAFWPITCGAVDLEGLAAARDQIWAEAAVLESKGHPIYLSRALYDKAKEITSERQEVDSWEDSVANAIGTLHDISINEILAGKYFMMRQSEINQLAQNRIARILKSPRFGFERYRKRPEMQWRYRKVGTGNTSGN